MRRAVFGLIAVSCVAAAAAQGTAEEVIVTGSYLIDETQMPAITLRRQADFLAQPIRLVNDSRAAELRTQEIMATVEVMLQRARELRNIELSYGSGMLLPVDLADIATQVTAEAKRIDTSGLDIFVKVALGAADDPKTKLLELRRFLDQTRLTGRTELMRSGEVALSVVDPDKYRYAILGSIAQENTRLLRTLGSSCRSKLIGLQNRVRWERSGIAELTLYVPYSIEISDCG
jgi:hypothetical protein